MKNQIIRTYLRRSSRFLVSPPPPRRRGELKKSSGVDFSSCLRHNHDGKIHSDYKSDYNEISVRCPRFHSDMAGHNLQEEFFLLVSEFADFAAVF